MTTSVILKASLILLAALTASACLRNGRASVRHLMLASAFAALLAMPVAASLLPTLVIELPAQHPVPQTVTTRTETRGRVVMEPSDQPVHRDERPRPSRTDRLLLGWLFLSAITFVPVLNGLWQVRHVRDTAQSWPEGQTVADALAESAGIRGRISVRRHRASRAPFTFGVIRPIVVFPVDADEWTRNAIEQALRHELEHVRRGDWLTQSIARAICALYWFHPLVWIAWRRLSLEAERACDDAVLETGTAREYAALLVSVAERAVQQNVVRCPSMANPGDLSVRVRSVLNAATTRGPIEGRRVVFAGTVVMLASITVGPLAVSSVAQSTSAPVQRDQPKQFEVASVKRVESPDGGKGVLTWRGETFVARRVTVRTLLQFAYGPVAQDSQTVRNLDEARLVGGPSWINSERFDVEAKMPAGLPSRDIALMLRGLLRDRFALAVHDAEVDMPVLVLSMARPDRRLGPQLRPAGDCVLSQAELATRKDARPCGLYNRDDGISAAGTRVGAFAFRISQTVGRLVVDETQLNGEFDFDLKFSRATLTPETVDLKDQQSSDLPSFFTALQEQLGMRLTSERRRIQVVAVDQISKPTEN